MPDQPVPIPTAEERLADACRVIRFLRSKCAGIAHLDHGKEAAREGLMITEGWQFLDHMEPAEAARTLIAMGDRPMPDAPMTTQLPPGAAATNAVLDVEGEPCVTVTFSWRTSEQTVVPIIEAAQRWRDAICQEQAP